MKRLRLLSVLLFAALLFNTCSEPIDFIGEVTTTVMAANDMFLKVTEVLYPSPNLTDANPGSQVIIQFDRDINIASVTSGSIKITNVTDSTLVDIQNPSFNAINRQLVFEPTEEEFVGYFQNEKDYTIEIVSVRGEDGSRLQDPYVWSFHTGTAPAGSISVSDKGDTGPESADAGFTNELSIQVTVASRNVAADSYFASLAETELSTPASIGGWENIGSFFNLDLSSDPSNGQKYVYAIFTDAAGDKFSRPVSAAIVLDRTTPLVEAGANVVSNSGFTRTATVTEANVKSMLWEMVSGPLSGVLAFSSPSSASTYVDHNNIDGNYTIGFTVKDKAGNTASDTISYTLDTSAPGNPSITTSAVSTVSTSLRWDWVAGSGSFLNYERKLNSGSWINTVYTYYTLSLTKTASTGGRYTLSVRAEDEAGNVSGYDSHSISYFPSSPTYLMPENGATWVSRYTNIDWPDFSGATGYLLYARIGGNSYGDPEVVSTSYFDPPFILDASTTYYWYYRPYATTTKNILGTSPEYFFSTGR